jgi:Swiss Army Knife RNA repair-like protein
MEPLCSLTDYYPEKIIFLDFDGVLNTHEQNQANLSSHARPYSLDRSMVERVNRIIIHTNSFVVVTSAWRGMVHFCEMSLAGFERMMLTHGFIVDRLIGITGVDIADGTAGTLFIENRGKLIRDWMEKFHTPKVHLTIDHSNVDIFPRLQINCHTGITNADADKAIAILNLRYTNNNL